MLSFVPKLGNFIFIPLKHLPNTYPKLFRGEEAKGKLKYLTAF